MEKAVVNCALNRDVEKGFRLKNFKGKKYNEKSYAY